MVARLGRGALFEKHIEAWANSPVVPDFHSEHRGEFTIAAVPRGNRKRLTNDELDTITAIVRDYGTWTASSFSALTRREQPWIDAREGLREDERGNRVISHGALANYYGNI